MALILSAEVTKNAHFQTVFWAIFPTGCICVNRQKSRWKVRITLVENGLFRKGLSLALKEL